MTQTQRYLNHFYKIFLCLFLYPLFLLKGQECIDFNISAPNGDNTVYLNCEDNNSEACVELTAQYEPVPSTSDYAVTPLQFQPVIPFNQGTSILNLFLAESTFVDDRFSPAIDLGFDFCFYDQSYDQVVIGSNGLLTFSEIYAGTVCPSGIPYEIPNSHLIGNSIFFPQQDFYFDSTTDSDILFEISGTAPCRKFVLNFVNARLFGCNNTATFQLVLYEGSNIIEMYLDEKPVGCNAQNSIAVLGIMNGEGDAGLTAPDRNTSSWSATQEAWRFSPAGESNPIITWQNSAGEVIGTGDTITVCSVSSDTITAEIDYQSCVDGNTYSDAVEIILADDFPIVAQDQILVCDTGNNGVETISLPAYTGIISANPESNFNFSFYTSAANAANQTNEISSLNISATTTVFVRIENINTPDCFIIEPVQFSFASSFFEDFTIPYCDNENDGIESNVDLQQILQNYFSGTLDNFTIHSSATDAQNGQNAMQFSDISAETRLWLNIQLGECSTVQGPFQFGFNSAPELENIPDIVYSGCDINSDNSEPFDWNVAIRSLIEVPAGVTLTIHANYQNAVNGSGRINNIRSNYTQIFVRAVGPNGCFSVYPVNVEVDFSGIRVGNRQNLICFDGTEDVTFDLMDFYESMINPLVNPYDVNFYLNYNDALQQINPVSSIQTITEDGSRPFRDFYVRFQTSDECYSIKTYRMYLVKPVPLTQEIEVCDFNADDIQTVTLSQFDNQIREEQTSVRYFLSEEDALNNTNAITSHTFSGTEILYVRLTVYHCFEVYPITFTLTDPPFIEEQVNISLENSCTSPSDEIVVNLQNFNNQLYDSEESYTVSYFLDYDELNGTASNPVPNPGEFAATDGAHIFALITLSDDTCPLVTTVVFNFVSHTDLNLGTAELYKCDFSHDLNEVFDLEAAIPLLTDGIPDFIPSNYIISYHNSLSDAQNDLNPLPALVTPNVFIRTIYYRFENIYSGCFDITELDLVTVYSPKIFNTELEICDLNHDGNYEVLLTDLIPLVNVDGENYTYTYHLTENDAIDRINEISGIYTSDAVPFEIWVRAENMVDCYEIAKVDLLPGAEITGLPDELTYEICETDNDGTETFNLQQIADELNLTPGSYSFFESLDDLSNGISLLDSQFTFSTEQNFTIFLMISQNGFCSFFTDIYFNMSYPPLVVLNDISVCADEEAEIIPVLENGVAQYEYEWIFNDQVISNESTLSGILEAGTYTLNINESGVDCTATYTCEVTFGIPEVEDEFFELFLCDTQENGIGIFDLEQISGQLLPQQTISGFYTYSNLASVITDPLTYQNLQAYNDLVYVLIEIPGQCAKFYPINLIVLEAPVALLESAFLCEDQNIFLNPQISASTGTLVYEWLLNGEPFSDEMNPQISAPGTYTLNLSFQEDNSCVYTFEAVVEQPVFDFTLQNISFCEGDSFEAVPVAQHSNMQFTYEWRDAAGNIVSTDLNLTGNQAEQYTFTATETESLCSKTYSIYVTHLPIEVAPEIYNLYTCDTEESQFVFDLTDVADQFGAAQQITGFYTASDLNAEINNSQIYAITSQNATVYALINDGSQCRVFYQINLTVQPKPEITFTGTEFCKNEVANVSTFFDNIYDEVSFEWSLNGSILSTEQHLTGITEQGLYIFNLHTRLNGMQCSFTYEVIIQALPVPEIDRLIVHSDHIQVVPVGAYTLEYSMDLVHWQSSPNFYNLSHGSHTFYVRFAGNQCISLPKSAYYFVAYNVITPNGDGMNDDFRIPGLDVFDGEKAQIRIFERSGKMIFIQSSDTEIIWNGKYNNRELPNGDYWYLLDLPDGQRKSGHITIINR